MAQERTYGFNKDDADALIQSIGIADGSFNEIRPGIKNDYAVILDAALSVATNSKTGATSCLATICVWDSPTEQYTETTRQITVWNHSESTGYAINTFGDAKKIDGHFWFFGDCAAMAAR